MSKGIVRDSKYRHVFGKAANKEACYEGLQPASISAPDSNLVAANSKYFAVAWKGGGGPFVVYPLACTGKMETVVNKEVMPPAVINGHSMPVQDLDFSPFHASVIASASEDSSVRVWNFEGKIDPASPLAEDQGADISCELQGHGKKATLVRWNPVASHVLTSAAFDNTVRVWDANAGRQTCIVSLDEAPQHIAWAYNGASLAIACKDKKVVLVDPRAPGTSVKMDAHAGSKGARVTFLGKTNFLATTGFSRTSDRQLFVYDVRSLSAPAPLSETTIDQSSGSLMPFFDPDTSLLYLSGKGDCNIRYYEVTVGSPHVHYVDQFSGKDPQRGAVLCPKGVCDVSSCEVARFLRLCDSKIEPLSFTVPRKSESGNEDLFPDTFLGDPSLTAEEWIAGQSALPLLGPLSNAGRGASGYTGARTQTKTTSASPMTSPPPRPVGTSPERPTSPKETAKETREAPMPLSEGTTSSLSMELAGTGDLGVVVKGLLQLTVAAPSADERVAALEARVRALEADNAELRKKNRELAAKLTD